MENKKLLPDANGMITIQASPEAQEMLKELYVTGGKEALYEENFGVVREKLLLCEPEIMPDVPTKNTLTHGTCKGFDLYALQGKGDYENIVLYIHGGAWVFGILPDHVAFCDELVDTLNAKVYMPLYPMGPKYSYRDTYDMLLAVYDELLKENKPIYVMGDSAGGQLTIAMGILARDNGRKAPDKLIALAPCADLSFTNPDVDEVEKRDPTLFRFGVLECCHMWAKELDLKDPAISFVYADVSKLPDTLMFVGTNDILCPDDLLLAERMKAAGDKVIVVKGEGLWHVYSVCNVPEKQFSLDLIREFCLG